VSRLDRLPKHLRLTARDHQAGVDLLTVLSRATWFRQRAALLAYGIDIGSDGRRPESGAESFELHLEGVVEMHPTVQLLLQWAKHQGGECPEVLAYLERWEARLRLVEGVEVAS
jgi:hypothetical protein